MLREWRAPGCDIQMNDSYYSCATQTGDAQGAPSASTVGRVMYGIGVDDRTRGFGIHLFRLPEPRWTVE